MAPSRASPWKISLRCAGGYRLDTLTKNVKMRSPMLRLLHKRLDRGLAPKRVEYSFEYTANWEIARRRAGSLEIDFPGSVDTILLERLLDELRLEGDTYAQTQQAVLLRCLALDEAWRQGMVPTSSMIHSSADRFRRDKGIDGEEAFARWLTENHLRHEEFLELMEDQARLEWIQSMTGIEVMAHVPDHLRVAGHYARLAKRARDKQRSLGLVGLDSPSPLNVDLTEDELLRWYFEERLGRRVASDVADYSRRAGFSDEVNFRRAVMREYLYVSRDKDVLGNPVAERSAGEV